MHPSNGDGDLQVGSDSDRDLSGHLGAPFDGPGVTQHSLDLGPGVNVFLQQQNGTKKRRNQPGP